MYPLAIPESLFVNLAEETLADVRAYIITYFISPYAASRLRFSFDTNEFFREYLLQATMVFSDAHRSRLSLVDVIWAPSKF